MSTAPRPHKDTESRHLSALLFQGRVARYCAHYTFKRDGRAKWGYSPFNSTGRYSFLVDIRTVASETLPVNGRPFPINWGINYASGRPNKSHVDGPTSRCLMGADGRSNYRRRRFSAIRNCCYRRRKPHRLLLSPNFGVYFNPLAQMRSAVRLDLS